MNLETRLSDLVTRWKQLRSQGQTLTPEELCQDCPELLEEFRRTLQKINTLHGMSRETTYEPTEPAVPNSLSDFGSYQLVKELGRGGMGIVYQAFDRKRQEMVALKTLKGVDPAALYRLKQEFRALSDVTHPNLVGLFELTATEQQCFFTMELIDGVNFLAYLGARAGQGTIDQTIDYLVLAEPEMRTANDASASGSTTGTPMEHERLRNALRQLATGLSALHAMGKLHRDIKPTNVLVTRDGRVVILDFGLAAELDWTGVHQSTGQHISGTIAYMSPEQAAGQALSPASDWYSVGVMLYEALTGQIPFKGTPFQVLMNKQKYMPTPPGELAFGIPQDLNDLCVALLDPSAAARPSGKAVLQILGSQSIRLEAVRSAQGTRTSFVGRERQLTELAGAFEATRRGQVAVVRMQGRSGAGKSVLAQQFLDQLHERGEAVVLAGKCYERESVPYKALDSLIDALSRYLRRLPTLEAQALLPREIHLLSRVFPVLGRVAAVAEAPARSVDVVDPQELRRRAFGALRELLARLGDRHPLVLLIDDLQWGDLDGVTQLIELFRLPDPPVLLLLACYRSEEADTSPCLRLLHRALERADASLDQRQISLEPLSHAEARALASLLFGRADLASEVQAEAIARESGGNPYFVHVLVQCLSADSRFANRSASAGNLVLDEVLWARVEALPAEARRLLEVIAVSGQPLRLAEACQAAQPIKDEHGTLAILRSSRLIRSSGLAELEEVETYHDRIRETILGHSSVEVMRGLHGTIARVLKKTVSAQFSALSAASMTTEINVEDDATLERKKHESKRIFDLAYHFDAAGESEHALPYALAMAEQARSQHALEIAERLYRIAERGAEKVDGATRYRVAESLGDVLMLRGSYAEAADRFDVAMALTSDTVTQAKIEGKRGELAFKQGDSKTATQAIERALRLLGKSTPQSFLSFVARASWEIGVQTLHTFFPRLSLARKKLEGAETEFLAIHLYSRLAYAYWFSKGGIPLLWAHLRHLNLAERYPPTPELAQAYSAHAPAMSLIPMFGRGIRYGEKSLAIRRALGDLWGQGQSLHFLGIALYASSRFARCIEKCREGITLLERTGDPWEANMARYQVAASLYRLGDLAGAVEEAKRLHHSGLDLGDIQASGISLDIWVRASRGQVAPETLQVELQRTREDKQAIAQVTLAEGVRLLQEGRPLEAAAVIEQGHELVSKAGLCNAWVTPLLPWLATALRRSAKIVPKERANERQTLLKRAEKAARKGVSVARKFQNDLPHALRECGLIAALSGNEKQARTCLDESLAIAEQQGARFEHAQTLLAWGHIGLEAGWPDAKKQIADACEVLRGLGADFALEEENGDKENEDIQVFFPTSQ